MLRKTLFSIIESPTHPNFSQLYQEHGFNEIRLESIRKAVAALKKQPPEFVVAEFFYGYGNNYAGVNVCNLDTFLHSLQKYAPGAKVIVLVEKPEFQYVEKLAALFPLHAVLVHPVSPEQISEVLR